MYSYGTSKLPCKKSRWDTFVVNDGVGIMISFVWRSVSFVEYGWTLMYFVCKQVEAVFVRVRAKRMYNLSLEGSIPIKKHKMITISVVLRIKHGECNWFNGKKMVIARIFWRTRCKLVRHRYLHVVDLFPSPHHNLEEVIETLKANWHDVKWSF